jgi:hypothetical protein
MLTHEFSLEMPHSAARIWALFQDYDRWTDYAPMVKRVDVLWPGDDDHNGRLRRVWYMLPGDAIGCALELVTDVVPEVGYTYRMLASDGNDHLGHVRLEPLGPNRTMFHFDETADMDPDVYKFVNEHNENSMRAASQYLTDHPEYRSDLVVADG